jgi:hypothetical protein
MQAPPPPFRWMAMITGHWVARAIQVAVRLELFENLSRREPCSSAQLALQLDLHEPSLFRLLRALASLGALHESSPRSFQLTDFGAYLRADHPQSLRGLAQFQGHPAHWQGWGQLESALRDGEPAFEAAHGQGFFDYAKAQPDLSAAFDAAMSDLSRLSAPELARAYDFSPYPTICDVGGGQGLLLKSILEKTPGSRGILFDLPHVLHKTQLGELASRVELIPGSFFDSIPPADLYIARHIIHDWSDEKSILILNKMRQSLKPRGKILLAEAIIPPGNDPNPAKFLDLEMLHATPGGRERSLEEFKTLLNEAGLQFSKIVTSPAGATLIEAQAPSLTSELETTQP